MPARRLSVTLPEDILDILKTKTNRSSFIAESIREKAINDKRREIRSAAKRLQEHYTEDSDLNVLVELESEDFLEWVQMLRQGEIYQINLDPTIGSEMTKQRTCVILNADDIGILPLKVAAPITDYKKHYANVPWMVSLEPNKINNLSEPSVIDLFQLRSLSDQRIIRRIGSLTKSELARAIEAVKLVFGIYWSIPFEIELTYEIECVSSSSPWTRSD